MDTAFIAPICRAPLPTGLAPLSTIEPGCCRVSLQVTASTAHPMPLAAVCFGQHGSHWTPPPSNWSPTSRPRPPCASFF